MDDKTLRQYIIDELDFEPSIDAANIGAQNETNPRSLTTVFRASSNRQ